jgi:hypothetical protein
MLASGGIVKQIIDVAIEAVEAREHSGIVGA